MDVFQTETKRSLGSSVPSIVYASLDWKYFEFSTQWKQDRPDPLSRKWQSVTLLSSLWLIQGPAAWNLSSQFWFWRSGGDLGISFPAPSSSDTDACPHLGCSVDYPLQAAPCRACPWPGYLPASGREQHNDAALHAQSEPHQRVVKHPAYILILWFQHRLFFLGD